MNFAGFNGMDFNESVLSREETRNPLWISVQAG
jgi:hypothetical protein